jgi:hypothetical protein
MFLIIFLLLYPEADKAVGISDKGELSNVTSNFGLIANLHYFTPAFHWPNSAPFQHQYSPGFGILAARNDTVIESFLNLANPEWAPLEGSFGTLYSGMVTTPDGTPIIATSDNIETWPLIGAEPTWPGPFRKDSTGQQVVGEFTSDQDLFCTFDDQSVFGLQVNQSAYSYGRIYAQDFIFYDFNVYCASGSAVDDVYLGFRGNFRCDYDMQDYIGLYRDSMVTFVYYWDADGVPFEPWESVGMIGVGFLNEQIENFHYYRKQDEPLDDFRLFPIISSDPGNPNIDSSLYFHGADIHIDDPTLVQALPPESTSAYNYIASTGAKNIGAGDTLQLTVVVICGEDSADLFDNLSTALVMADNYFLGSGPPSAPNVQAVADDRKVTLYWSSEPSESSSDILTGKQDFEGYKIYRSEDLGVTWGAPITNQYGNVVGYVPLVQFDLIDSIEGVDPAFPYQSLGQETGLKHTFVDTTVYNGIEYWYAVAAYDQGNQNPDSLEPSYENSRGRPSASNVVSMIAAPMPSGYEPPYIEGGDTLYSIGGRCDGLALVDILNPAELVPHTYRITFAIDSVYHPAETVWVDTTTFTLYDVTAQETLLLNHELTNDSRDNVPVVDGIRLTLLNSGLGLKTEWTTVYDDTSTFRWWAGYLGFQPGSTYIYGEPNFRVVVDRNANSVFGIEDGFGGDTLTIQMPLRVYDITDEVNPVEVSEFCWLLDYAYSDVFPPATESLYFSPEGWDLVPGGAAYIPDSLPGYAAGFFDQIGLWNGDQSSATSIAYFATWNGPETAISPSDGDEFTVKLLIPFSDTIYYEFTIVPPSIDYTDMNLDKVKVVPNPYVLASKFESTPYDRRLMFTNLPGRCEIMIYNIAGEHICTIEHNNELGYEYWDLRTKYGVEVAYGMYVYVVKTENEAKAKGKFVIIK